MKEFTNKIAIVTGGTRGIGRAITLELARKGTKVLALYARDRNFAGEVLKIAEGENLDIKCIRGDLTHPEKSREVMDEIKNEATHIDFIIHCAASGVHKNAIELSLKQMKWTFDINVFAIHNLLQEIFPMIPSGGRVIGVTSAGGTRVIPYYAAVGSSKGAMESLFRHYAHEWAPKGIAVNCVCPGLVLTDAVEAFPDKENRTQKSINGTPTGRLTIPEDVAQLVSFLCSPFASQIIGQTITIDGGKTLIS
jgi:enoyl-[acyl-carrier protein] reductase III